MIIELNGTSVSVLDKSRGLQEIILQETLPTPEEARAFAFAQSRVYGGSRIITPAKVIAPPAAALPQFASVDAFIDSIGHTPWFNPQREPYPEWKMFETYDAAHENASNDVSVRDLGYENAWGDIRRNPRCAGRYGAYIFAADAIRKRMDIYFAPRYATFDAQLLAACMAVYGNDERCDYARRRWAVWTSGYGLYCDYGGAFYVFRMP